MFKFIRRFSAAFAATMLGLSVMASAHAAVDVSAVVTEIEDTISASGPIPTIGAAVLLVIVAIAAFKWIRRSIS